MSFKKHIYKKTYSDCISFFGIGLPSSFESKYILKRNDEMKFDIFDTTFIDIGTLCVITNKQISQTKIEINYEHFREIIFCNIRCGLTQQLSMNLIRPVPIKHFQ